MLVTVHVFVKTLDYKYDVANAIQVEAHVILKGTHVFVRIYGLILFFPYLIWFLKHSVRPVLFWTKKVHAICERLV